MLVIPSKENMKVRCFMKRLRLFVTVTALLFAFAACGNEKPAGEQEGNYIPKGIIPRKENRVIFESEDSLTLCGRLCCLF